MINRNRIRCWSTHRSRVRLYLLSNTGLLYLTGFVRVNTFWQ